MTETLADFIKYQLKDNNDTLIMILHLDKAATDFNEMKQFTRPTAVEWSGAET